MTAPAGANLTSATTTTTTGPYTTASVSVANHELVIVFFQSRGTTARNLSSVSGLGLTWSSPHNNALSANRIIGYSWAYNNSGSTQTGTLSISTSGSSSVGVDWSVDKWTGARSTGPINVVDNNGTGSPATATEAAYASPDSTTVMHVGQAVNATASESGSTFYGAGTNGLRINASNDHWINGIEGGTPTVSRSMATGSGTWASTAFEIPAVIVSKTVALNVVSGFISNWTPSIARVVSKTVAQAITGTTAAARSAGKLVAQAITGTPSVARSVGKAVSRAITGTVAVTEQKIAGVLVAVTTTLTPSIARAVSKTVAYAATMTIAKTKAVAKEIDYAWTFKVTGVIANRDIIIARLVSKETDYAMDTELRPKPGNGNKVINKLFNRTATMGGGISASGGGSAPLIVKLVGKEIDYAAALSAIISRLTSKAFSFVPLAANTGADNQATVVWTVAVTRTRAVLVALAATMTTAVMVRRAFSRLVELTMPPGGTSGTTGEVVSRLGRVILGRSRLGARTAESTGTDVGSIVGDVHRTTGKSISRTATMTVAAGKGYFKLVALSLTATGAIARAVSKRVTRTISTALAVSRVTGKAVTRTAALAPAVTRGVQKVTAYAMSGAPNVARSTNLRIMAAVTAALNIDTVKSLFHAVVLGFTTTTSASRTTGKAVSASAPTSAAVARSTGKAVAYAASMTLEQAKQWVHSLTLPIGMSTSANAGHIFNRAVALAATLATIVNRRIPQRAATTMTMTARTARRTGKRVALMLHLLPHTVRKKVARIYRLVVAGWPFSRIKAEDPVAAFEAGEPDDTTWKAGSPER